MTTPRIARLRGTLALFVFVTIAAVACPVQAADKYFDAATSGSTWDTATTANWSTTSGGPYDTTWDSDDRAIFEGTGGTVTLSDVYANYLVFTADGYTLSGGTLTMGNPGGTNNFQVDSTYTAIIASDISQPYSTGINKRGTGTLVLTGTVTSTAGNNRAEAGTLELADGGTLTGSMWIADSGGTTGRFLVSGGTYNSTTVVVATRGDGTFDIAGGIVNLNGGLYLGHSAGAAVRTATVNIDGGTVSIGGNVVFANDDTCSGIYNQTGGDVTFSGSGYFYIGNMGAATQEANFSGGTFTAASTGSTLLAVRGTASLNVSGTADVTLVNLGIGHSGTSGATGIVNLDGGTLTLGSIYENSGGHTSTVNFNGGTLRPSASTTTFMQGLDYAYVASGGAIIDTNGFDITIAQPLLDGGGGGLTKLGAGTLALSGTNSYTGETVVSNGTLQIGAGGTTGTLGVGTVVVNSAGTLQYYRSDTNVTIANDISGDGALSFLGTGASNQSDYNLTGANGSFTGAINIDQARLRENAIAALGNPSVINVASGGQFYATVGGTYAIDFAIEGDGWTESAGQLGAIRLENGANITGTVTLTGDARIAIYSSSVSGTISGNVTGSHQLEKYGAGGLFLSGNNDYSGGTLVSQGRLRADSPTAFGTGTVTVQNNAQAWVNNTTVANDFNITGNGWPESAGQLGAIRMSNATITGNVVLSGDSRISVYSGSETGTIDGVISGAYSLEKTGAGTLILNGANTYSGTTTVTAGLLDVRGYQSIRGPIVIKNGATLRATQNRMFNGVSSAYTVSIEEGGTFNVPGTDENPGKLIMSGGQVTGSGTLYMRYGVQTLASATTTSVINGPLLQLVSDQVGNQPIPFDVADGAAEVDLLVNSSIRRIGGLTKSGAGTMVVTAANTYSGTTTVSDGTLLVNNTSGSGTSSGDVVVDGGTLGGSGFIGGEVFVNSGTLSPGNSPGILTLNNGLTFTGGTYEVDIEGTTAGTGYDQVVVTSGDVDLGLGLAGLLLNVDSGFSAAIDDYLWIIDNTGSGTTSGYFTGLDDGSSVDVNGRRFYVYYNADHDTAAFTGGNDVLLTSVPEPSTLAMLLGLAGLGLLGYWRRRR